ncbi:MAG: hypothetical protein R2814_18230 [Flavobacteriaceae bacterium]
MAVSKWSAILYPTLLARACRPTSLFRIPNTVQETGNAVGGVVIYVMVLVAAVEEIRAERNRMGAAKYKKIKEPYPDVTENLNYWIGQIQNNYV